MDTQPTHIPPYYDIEDELTLKDIVIKIKDYLSYLWTKKWIILMCGAIGFVAFYLLNKNKPTTYTSGLSFIINEENNAASALELSELTEEAYNINKLVALARSSNITHKSLMQEVVINGNKDLLANHIIKIYDLGVPQTSFTSAEGTKVLASLHELIAGNQLSNREGFLTIAGDKSKIVSVKVSTYDSGLSDAILEVLFKNLQDFYIDQTIGSSRRTLELLKDREEEMSNEFHQAEDELIQEINQIEQSLNVESDDKFDLLYEVESEKIEALKKEFEKNRDDLNHKINRLQIDILNKEKNQIISKSNDGLESLYNSILKDEELYNKQQIIDELNMEMTQLNLKFQERVKITDILQNFDVKSIEEYDGIKKKIFFIEDQLSQSSIVTTIDSLNTTIITNKEESRAWREQLMRNVNFLFESNKSELGYAQRKIDSLDAEIQNTLALLENTNIISDNVDQSANYKELEEKVKTLLLEDHQINKALTEKITNIRLDRLSSQLNQTDEVLNELRKNKRTLEFTIDHNTPDFQIIDRTISPIVTSTSAWILGIIGLFAGLVLSMSFMVIKRTYDLEMAK